MVSWNEYVVKQEQFKDFRRDADKERLIRQALAVRSGSERSYTRALRRLGYWLAAWECYLRERFASKPCPNSGSRIGLYTSRAA